MNNDHKVNISLAKLRSEVLTREDRKFSTFEKLLEMCYTKIITTNKTSSEFSCIFVVPRIVFGLPLFDMEESIKYIMSKLVEKGFETHLALPNKIFISWRPESEQNATYCRELYQLDAPFKSKLAITNSNINSATSNNGSEIKLFSAQPKQNQKKYRPIEDYKSSRTSTIYEPDDINLFRNKIDELFT